MLVRGWAVRCITGIGIRSAAANIALIALFRLAAAGAQLPPQEHGKPEQERCRHDQRRRQRLQISDHASASSSAAAMPPLALLLMAGHGVVPALSPARRPTVACARKGPSRIHAGVTDQAVPDACAGWAPRGRIRRRVPRGPAYPLAVLPRMQQGLRNSAPCLVG